MADSELVECPYCQAVTTVPPENLNKRLKCPKCDRPYVIGEILAAPAVRRPLERWETKTERWISGLWAGVKTRLARTSRQSWTWLALSVAGIAGIFLGYLMTSPSRERILSLEAEKHELESALDHDSRVHAENVFRMATEIERLRELLKPVGLSDNAKGLLKRAVENPRGTISIGSTSVSVTGWSSEKGNPRDFAKWKAACDELLLNGLVEYTNSGGSSLQYRVTKAGYEYPLSP